ncbi:MULTISPECIES: PKD domain-containing protein [Methylomicrobium]|uniref:REJ domain protein n=1 Tax=Methylomicrobium album BG8 TaxID=686340 RepID=H8GJ24_METAL|nr:MULTISPECIES: Ig-like domain-containing protein [Methylomicrobium]EIC31531.1 REJ domain protein [Methylomicrobium album BG8]
MRHLYRLTLAAGLLAAAGPACPDNARGPDPYGAGFGFDQPDTAPWGLWTRGDAGTLYAEWDSFSDASHGTDSDRTSAPDVGTFGAVSPWLGWNAGTIRTSTGNLYSFSGPERFEVNFEGEVPAEPQRAVLQIETQGTALDVAGVTLNGAAPTFSAVTFNDPAFATSQGPVTLQHRLFFWDLPTAPATYQFVFGSAEHSMSLTQVAVDVGPRHNQAPEAQAGAAQWVSEGTEVTLYGSGSDPEGQALGFHWIQTAGPSVMLRDAASATPRFTAPEVNATTTLGFQLVAIDAEGLPSNAANTQVNVRDLDSQPPGTPFAEAGTDQSVRAGVEAVLDGSASSDPEGQALSYQWTQLAGPTVTLDDPTAIKPRFTTPRLGNDTVLTFQLVITDTDGNESDAATVNVDVKWHNEAPVADPGAASTLRAGAVKVLGGESYDPDGDPLAYHWTQTGGPTVALSSDTAANPSFVAPVDAIGQTLTFSLTVSDGRLESSQQTVTVAIVANSAPTVDADTGQVFGQDARVVLHSTASDPDGDELTYSWEQTGGPTVVLSGPDTPSPEFIAPSVMEGTVVLEFRLTVSDGYAPDPLSASDTVRVLVNSNGQALDCSHAVPSRATLWPSNRGMKKVRIDGVTGPDPFRLTITGITQDEPVFNPALKDRTRRDAKIVTPKATRKNPMTRDSALLRAERQGLRKKSQPFSGNGRVYQLNFSADDGTQFCEGSIHVQVPPTRDGTAVDDGQAHDATVKIKR